MDDKKKTIVVVALFVIILAVGAFQLTGGSSEPPVAAATAKKDPKKVVEEPEDTVKNTDVSALLAHRDPFTPDELPKLPDLPAQEPQQRPVKQPPPLSGSIPPVFPGDFGQLPGADITATEPPKPDVFSYSLAGIVLGDRSAALFADGAGNQRLIREGGLIDDDSRLVAIARDKVTVSYKGKKQTLTLGGNPSGN